MIKNNPWYFDLGVLITLFFCGFALYSTPLHSASFYFDDRSSIVNNGAIKKIDILKIFNAFNSRSLVGLSFAVNYQLCGLNPAGYRIFNLLIHCFNAFLVFLLTRITLSLYSAQQKKNILYGRWVPFFASMLFLCHPIQTEAVNSITQRFVLMGTSFYLLTLFLFIQYRYLSQKKYLIAAAVTALAAMLCKEFVVTLPLMLFLYDFYFLRPLNNKKWKHSQYLIPFFIIALVVPILLLRTSHETIRAANIADSSFNQHVDITRAKGSISRKEYFLTELNVMCTYVRLLFFPVNQNFDYDYPLSHGIEARTFMSAGFLLFLLFLAKITFKSYRIISFCILWFFIALSVESSFIPIGHVIAEYRLYLASAGFVLLVSFLIYGLPIGPIKLNMIAAVILIGFSIGTVHRNQVWKDEFSLWNDTVKKSPHKARAYLNRGLEYFNQGKLDQAFADFNKTIAINPGSAAAYNDLSVLYALNGNLAQSLYDSNKAIEINPDYADAYKNRALTYYYLKEYDKAWKDVYKAEKTGAVMAPQLIAGLNEARANKN